MTTTARDVDSVLASRYTLTEKGVAATDEHALAQLVEKSAAAGHRITVTPGPLGRVFVDCTCGDQQNFGQIAVRASKHAANLAAIDHAREVTR